MDINCLKLSKTYNIKKQLIKEKKVPTITAVRQSLGDPLAEIYFQHVPNSLKGAFGLEPFLKGPGSNLWTYPQDKLNNIFRIKPVVNQTIKALTHQGILAIGDEILKKFDEEKDLYVKDVIRDQDELWKWILKEECRKCVRRAIRKERKIQDKDIENMMEEFQKVHKVEMEQLKKSLNLKMERAVNDSNKDFKMCAEKEKEDALHDLGVHLKNIFRNKMDDLRFQLKEQYDNELRKEKESLWEEMKSRSEAHRQQLESQMTVNLIYAASMERHKYLMKLDAREKVNNDKINKVNLKLNQYKRKFDKIKNKLEQTRCIEKHLRENIAVICKEFRQLLSLHFNMPIDQLEFIPNIEKRLLAISVCDSNIKEIEGEGISLTSSEDESVSELEDLDGPTDLIVHQELEEYEAAIMKSKLTSTTHLDEDTAIGEENNYNVSGDSSSTTSTLEVDVQECSNEEIISVTIDYKQPEDTHQESLRMVVSDEMSEEERKFRERESEFYANMMKYFEDATIIDSCIKKGSAHFMKSMSSEEMIVKLTKSDDS